MISPTLLLTLLLLALPVSAVADSQREAPAGVRFSVHGMSCQACAKSAAKRLRKLPGARKVAVDFESKQGVAWSRDGNIVLADIQAALSPLGFEVLAPEAMPLPPLDEAVRARLDIRTVSHGEEVAVKEELARGKVTIVDYFAEWCAPCHLLDRHLERLVLAHEDRIAVRRIDILKWGSAAARQAEDEFGLPGLPYVRVFGPTGRLLGSVRGNFPEKIEELARPHLKAAARPER